MRRAEISCEIYQYASRCASRVRRGGIRAGCLAGSGGGRKEGACCRGRRAAVSAREALTPANWVRLGGVASEGAPLPPGQPPAGRRSLRARTFAPDSAVQWPPSQPVELRSDKPICRNHAPERGTRWRAPSYCVHSRRHHSDALVQPLIFYFVRLDE
ncbi:hypothetical protein MTO96_012000 [Rhipicephalus appendiculatus]